MSSHPLGGTAIQTNSGHAIDFMRPDPNEIIIEDIAVGLSNVCRYAGQSDCHYSVAQHSVYIARMLPQEYELAGLMHDAAEAYMGDATSPLKKVLGASWKDIEDRLMQCIAERFGFQYPVPACVMDVDSRFRIPEARSVLHIIRYDLWGWNLDATDECPLLSRQRISGWKPKTAKMIFLDEFNHIKFRSSLSDKNA